jgi:hypothetical protein
LYQIRVSDHLENSNTHKMIPIAALYPVFSQSYGNYWLFSRVFENFIQEISKFSNFQYQVIWRNPIRTKWYQSQLPSLQLTKVMTIPNFRFWVFQNLSSKNFQTSKFWVCHFLIIAKTHLSSEHINTLNSCLLLLFVKYEIFKILNFKLEFHPKFQLSSS